MLVQAIKNRKIAFARNAESGVDAVGYQCIGDQVATGTRGA